MYFLKKFYEKSVKVSGYSRKLKSTGNLWKSTLKINWHSQQGGIFYILFLEKPIIAKKVVHEISHFILQIEWNILKLDWVFKIYLWYINRDNNFPIKKKKENQQ